MQTEAVMAREDGLQDVLLRMLDSVIGCFKPHFLEDIGDSGDL